MDTVIPGASSGGAVDPQIEIDAYLIGERQRDKDLRRVWNLLTSAATCWDRMAAKGYPVESEYEESLESTFLREASVAWALLERHPELARRGVPRDAPIPGALRIAVFERDAYRCVRCNGWMDLTVDHVVSVLDGGLTIIGNLQTLCRSHNSEKGIGL